MILILKISMFKFQFHKKYPNFRGVYMYYPCDVIGHNYKTIVCTYEMYVTRCQNCGQYGIYYEAPKTKNFSNKNKKE